MIIAQSSNHCLKLKRPAASPRLHTPLALPRPWSWPPPSLPPPAHLQPLVRMCAWALQGRQWRRSVPRRVAPLTPPPQCHRHCCPARAPPAMAEATAIGGERVSRSAQSALIAAQWQCPSPQSDLTRLAVFRLVLSAMRRARSHDIAPSAAAALWERLHSRPPPRRHPQMVLAPRACSACSCARHESSGRS